MLKLGHLAALYARQRNPRLLDDCQGASVPTAETNLPDLSYSRSGHAAKPRHFSYPKHKFHLRKNDASINRCSDYTLQVILKVKSVKLTSVLLSALEHIFTLKRN